MLARDEDVVEEILAYDRSPQREAERARQRAELAQWTSEQDRRSALAQRYADAVVLPLEGSPVSELRRLARHDFGIASRYVTGARKATLLEAMRRSAAGSYRTFYERFHCHDDPEQDAATWLAARRLGG